MKELDSKAIASPRDSEEKEKFLKLRQMLEEEGFDHSEDTHILAYLRYRNGSVDAACETLLRSFQNRKSNFDQESFRLPSMHVDELRSEIFGPLENTDEDGSPILLWRFGRWEPRKTTFMELMISISFVIDIIMARQSAQTNGIVFIVDCQGFGFSHALSLTKACFQLIFSMQEAVPLKFKNIHVINSSSIVSSTYNVIAPLLKQKMRNRLIIHPKGFSTLHSYINPTFLPPEYDGTGEGMENKFVDSIMANEQVYRRLSVAN